MKKEESQGLHSEGIWIPCWGHEGCVDGTVGNGIPGETAASESGIHMARMSALHTTFFFPQVSRDGRWTVRRGSEVVLGAGWV